MRLLWNSILFQQLLAVFGGFASVSTDVRTDRRSDGHTEGRTYRSTDVWTFRHTDGQIYGRTDKPSYTDARTHLKMSIVI